MGARPSPLGGISGKIHPYARVGGVQVMLGRGTARERQGIRLWWWQRGLLVAGFCIANILSRSCDDAKLMQAGLEPLLLDTDTAAAAEESSARRRVSNSSCHCKSTCEEGARAQGIASRPRPALKMCTSCVGYSTARGLSPGDAKSSPFGTPQRSRRRSPS